MTLQVSYLAAGDEASWDAFVTGRPGALLYHGTGWRDLLVEFLGCESRYLVARGSDGEIRGVLPLLACRGPWGEVLNSLPFYGSHGGILAVDDAARSALAGRYDELAGAAAAATLVDIPMQPPNPVAATHGDSRIGQLTPIGYAADHAAALMASFHYKTRNAIRKAEKLGVVVAREDEALDFLAAVHEENMAAIGGRAKPRRFFELARRHFAPGSGCRIHVARLAGEPVAALLTFRFNGTVEYFTPVVREAHRESQALSLAIFHAMSEASAEGLAWWNWGGTWASQDGVYRFKSRWGTQDHHYHYHVRVNEPGLRAAKRADLEAAYPYFYVLPYSILDGES